MPVTKPDVLKALRIGLETGMDGGTFVVKMSNGFFYYKPFMNENREKDLDSFADEATKYINEHGLELVPYEPTESNPS